MRVLMSFLFFATIVVNNQFGSALPIPVFNNTDDSFNSSAAYPTKLDETNYYDNDDMPIEIENDSGNDKLELQNEELKETIKQEVIKYEENKKACYMKDPSLFYDANKGSCESCENFCMDGNLTHCGFQCKDYFNSKKVRNDIVSVKDDLNVMGSSKVDTYVVVILFAVIIGYSGFLIYFWTKTRADSSDVKLQLQEVKAKLNQVFPEGDRKEETTTEKDQMISTQAEKESTT